ncbi:hypothetical protein ABID56_001436 [Alkalibacillus flavidus]|uniref:Uncharacterized protein n=1 Tax=Alkalibacillus flavidus TaxID=546021 RepID=A0ABV2KUU5_9BACI
MSYNTWLMALIGGVLTFVFAGQVNPLIITNVLLGGIVGLLLDMKHEKSS